MGKAKHTFKPSQIVYIVSRWRDDKGNIVPKMQTGTIYDGFTKEELQKRDYIPVTWSDGSNGDPEYRNLYKTAEGAIEKYRKEQMKDVEETIKDFNSQIRKLKKSNGKK